MSGGDLAVALVGLLIAAVVIALGGYLLVAYRGLSRHVREYEQTVDELRAEMARLSEQQAAPQSSSVVTLDGPADYVITAGDGDRPRVSNQAVVSATLGEPLIKVAAFSYAVRHALREEKRAHIAYQMRREYRRRRRRGRAAARRVR